MVWLCKFISASEFMKNEIFIVRNRNLVDGECQIREEKYWRLRGSTKLKVFL